MSGSDLKDGLCDVFASFGTDGSRRRKKRPSPVSIRFSDEERAFLKPFMHGEAFGPYIKRYVLKGHKIKRKRARIAPSKQDQAIARVLRGLGRSGIAGVLNDLLLAVEEGRLFLDCDDELALRRAACEIASMRNDLVAALGLQSDESGL